MQMRTVGYAVLAAVAWSCSPPTSEDPTLTLRASPVPYTPGQSATVVVTATAADGRIGVGTVRVSSESGSLVDGVDLTLDGYGTAKVAFVCDAPCSNPVLLSAVWGRVSTTLSLEVSSGGVVPSCVVGTVTSQATATNLSLFGTPVYFQGGTVLSAGTYRLKNNGGCIRYGTGQNWTVHAYGNGDVSWWIVGDTTATLHVIPPGTVGFQRVPGAADIDVGSFTAFSACDGANRALAPKDFSFPGGRMGIWLKDDIYADNTSGEGGKNPSWTLSRVTSTCP